MEGRYMSAKNAKAIRKWAKHYHKFGNNPIRRAKEVLKKIKGEKRIKFLEALRKSI